LTALNLSDNYLEAVPQLIKKMPNLAFLDLSGNADLQVLQPLTWMGKLPNMQLVDFRGIHDEAGVGYWTESKCTTMRYISAAAKQLKRRCASVKLLVDTD
jgi:hypothetical protein